MDQVDWDWDQVGSSLLGLKSSWDKSLDQGQVGTSHWIKVKLVQVIGIQVKFYFFLKNQVFKFILSYQVQVTFSCQELQVTVGCRVFLPSSLLGDQQIIQSFKLYAVIEQ